MKKIDNVCIVGGGSAGWLAASYLTNQIPQIKFTMIESPTIKRVGVGEASLLGFIDFIQQCGVQDESEFLVETKGTFKSGILFKNWTHKERDIWHPFSDFPQYNEKEHLGDYFSNLQEDYNFLRDHSPYYNHIVLENKVSPNSAYHFDADLLAEYLKKLNINNLERYISATVTKINTKDNEINSLELDNNEIVTADLFLDCTGFRASISSCLEGSKWIDKSDMLFCNAAVAHRVKYNDREQELTPYTTSQCDDLGWIFKIPVQDRIGSGLLYSRDLTTRQEAEDPFVEHWGGEDKLINAYNFNHIKFDPKYNSSPWLNNVISVGLAGGFVEPLESSSIHLTQDVLELLAGRIRKKYYTDSDKLILNNKMSEKFEETFDFIALHYLNNSYDSKFWNYVRENIKITDTLKHRIEYYVEHGSHNYDMVDGTVFAPHSWVLWMEGVDNRHINKKKMNIKNYETIKKLVSQDVRYNEKLKVYKHTNYEMLDKLLSK